MDFLLSEAILIEDVLGHAGVSHDGCSTHLLWSEPCDRSPSIVGLALQHEHFITTRAQLIMNSLCAAHLCLMFYLVRVSVVWSIARAAACNSFSTPRGRGAP